MIDTSRIDLKLRGFDDPTRDSPRPLRKARQVETGAPPGGEQQATVSVISAAALGKKKQQRTSKDYLA